LDKQLTVGREREMTIELLGSSAQIKCSQFSERASGICAQR